MFDWLLKTPLLHLNDDADAILSMLVCFMFGCQSILFETRKNNGCLYSTIYSSIRVPCLLFDLGFG